MPGFLIVWWWSQGSVPRARAEAERPLGTLCLLCYHFWYLLLVSESHWTGQDPQVWANRLYLLMGVSVNYFCHVFQSTARGNMKTLVSQRRGFKAGEGKREKTANGRSEDKKISQTHRSQILLGPANGTPVLKPEGESDDTVLCLSVKLQ